MSTTHAVIMLTSLLLGLAVGAIIHRANFCLVCGLRNYFLFRQKFMLRMIGILVVASMVLFEGARLLGLLPLYPFPLLGPPSIVNIMGGVVFGVGMVLAGGCAIGTLCKLGGGSVISFLALVGLIAGSAMYAEIHPLWKKVADAGRLSPHVTLPQLLHVDPLLLVGVSLVGAVLLGMRWRMKTWQHAARIDHYMQPWKAALYLSIIGTVSAVLVGMPLGVTTSYAKAGAFLESLVDSGHVASLPFFQANPFNVVYPWSGEQLVGGAGPVFDSIAAVQVPLIVGIILGAMASAMLLNDFHVHLRVPVPQLVSGLIGGLLMGMASRLTPGCNIWHVCGGLPIFAMQSILFVAGLIPGAWLGSRLLVKLVIRA